MWHVKFRDQIFVLMILQCGQFSSVQLLSRVQLFATPWMAACQASLFITISRSSLRLTSIDPWCHSAISSSVVPFSSCPKSFPASESFPMSQLFAWGGQNTGVSTVATFLPKKSQGCAQSCPTLCEPARLLCHGIFQTRMLEWAAIFYSRGSSSPRDQIHVSCVLCTAGRVFATSTTWEVLS